MLLHMDGQTDMTKQIVAFHNFANVPKNDMYLKILVWDQKKKKRKRKTVLWQLTCWEWKIVYV